MTRVDLRASGRLGAIGDIHAEDEALARALDFFASSRVDRVLAVGDIVDGAGDASRCCALLAAASVDAVRGNHDRWILGNQLRSLPEATPVEALDAAARAYLAGLPATREYDTAVGPLLLCHGLDGDDMNRLGPDDTGYGLASNLVLQRLIAARQRRWIVGGHTHRRMVRHIDRLTIINAGTLHRAHDPCCVLIDLVRGQVTFHDITAAGIALASVHSLDGEG